MKWLILGLLLLGLALVGLGYASTQSGASADEKVGGALPILLGLAVLAADVIVTFAWLIFRA